MKLYLLTLALMVFVSTISFSQSTDSTQVDSVAIYNSMKQKEAQQAKQEAKPQKQKTPFVKKLYTGGNIGMSFAYATSIRIEPLIGYRINKFFNVGTKGFYQYTKYRDTDVSYHDYGGSIFGQLHLFNLIYFHLEPELMNYQYSASSRQTVPFIWVGAGIRKMTGKRTWITAHILFDLLNDDNSPYNNWEPRYSVGVGFGL